MAATETEVLAEGQSPTAEEEDEGYDPHEEGPNQMNLKVVHHKYRTIEGSRSVYHGESESIMRRQEALLETLKNENLTLRDKVESYRLPDVSKETRFLQSEASKFTSMVEIEAKKLEELESSVLDSIEELQNAKRGMGGTFAAREKHRTTMIRIGIMENRLHKATMDLNLVEKKNKALKHQMQELEDEREFFEGVRQNMERDLEWKEQEMEEAVKTANFLYDERNDFEERITDIVEIHGDMEAYNLWQDTEGWAIMDSEPLAKIQSPAEHLEAYEENRKLPMECSAGHRQWIEINALSNIQDIFEIEDMNQVVSCVQEMQQRNTELFDLISKLLKAMNEMDSKLQASEVRITVKKEDAKAVIINRKLDMEQTLEAILDLLKDMDLDDEEFLPVIREMRKTVSTVFKEAGCNVDDDEVEYSGDSVATVRYKSGKALPLEVAIVEWFVTIEHFIDQLSGTLR